MPYLLVPKLQGAWFLMALTKEEKRRLAFEINDYIIRGISKREAKYALIKEGFRASTIDEYWSVLKSAVEEIRKEEGF